MDIERVNDNTVKFFISYRDIEDRGFDRDEIWYDRERGEELFWEMMDEAANKGDFELEGPLWIQVQAFEKGLEIIVTKAKVSQDGTKLELPLLDEKDAEISIEYHREPENIKKQSLLLNEEKYLLVKFQDFEDAIQLAHSINANQLFSDLYFFEDAYYMYFVFKDNRSVYSEDKIEILRSQILEYSEESKLTIHRLQEYGKRVMKHNALEQLKTYFNP